MNPTPHRHRGILFMITSSLFFAVMGALVKYATGRIPFLEAVFFRSAVMLVLLIPWMIHKKISFRAKNYPVLLLRCASGFTALCLSFYVVTKLALADASILNRTAIPFVAILSLIFLREKVTAPLIIYTLCSLVGAGLIIKPDFAVVNVAGFLGLLAGFLAAVAYVSIKELHESESPLTIVFYFALFGTIVALALSLGNFVIPQGTEALALVGIGLAGTIAQSLMTYAYRDDNASIVSPFSFSTVLFSGLWGFLFWQEIPDWWSVMGALLIIACGIGIMKLKKSRGETAIEVTADWAEQEENKT